MTFFSINEYITLSDFQLHELSKVKQAYALLLLIFFTGFCFTFGSFCFTLEGP